MPSPDRALRAVAATHDGLLNAVDAQTTAVVDARRAGATVQRIAEVLGRGQPAVSRQYAALWADVEVPSRSAVDPAARDAALAAVAAAMRAVWRAESAELEAVAAARNAGVTWEQIGGQVGLARSNATTRFGAYLVAGTGGQVVVRPSPPGRVAKAVAGGRGHRLSASEQASLVRVQMDRHGDRLPAVLVAAGRLRLTYPSLSQPRLAALAGVPLATLQHRLERLLAFGSGPGRQG